MWSGREMFLTVNSRWEVVDPGKGLSFYSLAWYLVRKNKKKVHFKKLPCQCEPNSIVWKPRMGEAQRCKLQQMSKGNLAYRRGGKVQHEFTGTYPELWKIMSPPLAQAPWSLFLKAMRPSIMAGTRGFSGSASWCGRNLKQEAWLMQSS